MTQRKSPAALYALRRLGAGLAALALTSAALALPMAGRATEPNPIAQEEAGAAPIAGLTAAQVAAASVASATVAVSAVQLPSATAGRTMSGGAVAVVAVPLVLADAAPVAVEPPRDDPAAIPHSDVLLPATIVNNLLAPPPVPAQEANTAADAIREIQGAPGKGITEAVTPLANGITLFAPQRSTLIVTLMPVGSATGGGKTALLPTTGARTVVAAQNPEIASALAAGTAVVTKSGEPIKAPIVVGGGKTVYSPFLIAPTEVTVTTVSEVEPPFTSSPAPTAPAATAAPLATQAGARVYSLIDHACVDFNAGDEWASRRVSEPSDIWTDWFAGWAPFAVDEGYYQAQNVTFSLERVVGPGSNYGPDEHSAKIASNQPYAAGLGSPLLRVRPGAVVIVSANYLIFDHDTGGADYDWASLGIKPDAWEEGATYVNGLTRGRWELMTHSVVAGESGQIMVLLQAHSPAALNSNIYFDNVRIWVDGLAVEDCRYE